VSEIQLLDSAGLAADENDIHRELRSNAVHLEATLRGLGVYEINYAE
jgi:hypothetical protein